MRELKTKIPNFLIRCFYLVCGFFPFIMAFIFAIICLFNLLWRKTPVAIYNIPSIDVMKSMPIEHLTFAFCVCIIMFALFVLAYKLAQKYANILTKKAHFKIAAVLFLAVFLVSSIYIFAFGANVVPFTEYSYSWLAAQGDTFQLDRYSSFFSWSIFVVYIKFLISIFGANYFVVLILNAVFRGIVAALLYAIMFKISKKASISVLAALIYGFMPSAAMHAFTGGPEILSTVFSCLFVLCACFLYEAKTKNDKLKYCAFMGFSIVMAYCFKTLNLPITLATALIAFILYKIKNSEKRINFIDIKTFFLSALIMLLCVIVPLKAITLFAENYLDIKYATSNTQPLLAFAIGLDLNGHGQIIVSQYVNMHGALLRDESTRQNADRIIWDKLKDDWENASLSDIAYWQITKNVWAWQDDLRPSYFFKTALEDYEIPENKAALYSFANEYIPAISQVYYAMLLLLSAIICFVNVKKGSSFGVFVVALFVFGFAFGLMFNEAQSHYKAIVIPFICILAALGLETIINITPKLRAK